LRVLNLSNNQLEVSFFPFYPLFINFSRWLAACRIDTPFSVFDVLGSR